MGAQFIGMNFQNINKYNYFVQSKFIENGGPNCGYLLKP